MSDNFQTAPSGDGPATELQSSPLPEPQPPLRIRLHALWRRVIAWATKVVASVWQSLLRIGQFLQKLNHWLTAKLHIPGWLSGQLVNIEIVGFFGAAVQMIQVGEYLTAIVFWVAAGLIWVSRLIYWKTISGSPRRIAIVRTLNIILALIVVSTLIVWTNIKRGDQAWTALQKLWEHNEIRFLTIVTNKEYEPGTLIEGIVWKPDYTELDVIINNPTDENFDDLNILIRPDYPVAQIAQMSPNLADVSFEDKDGFTMRAWIEESPSAGAPFGPASPYVLLATDAGYKVHCGRIPPTRSLRLIMALVNFGKSIPYKAGMALPAFQKRDFSLELNFSGGENYWFGLPGVRYFAARPNPHKLNVDGSYVADGKRHRVKKEILTK